MKEIIQFLIICYFLNPSSAKTTNLKRPKTLDLVIIKTPAECQKRQKEDTQQEIIQSDSGQLQDFRLGKIWKKEYSYLIKSIESQSRVYALSANTSCHWTSIFNNIAGMFIGSKHQTIFSTRNEFKLVPPGGKKDYLDNEMNFALPEGFYPVAIKRDFSDHLYQLRTCERLKTSILFESFLFVKQYWDDVLIMKEMGKIFKEEDFLKYKFVKEKFKFQNIEEIYEKILLEKISLKEENLGKILLLYHVNMYAKYFGSNIAIASIMEPFVKSIMKRLKKYGDETTKRRIRHKKRLQLYSASQKIMIGMNNLIFGVDHKKAYGYFKQFVNNTKLDFKQFEGIIQPGSNLVLEIYKSSEVEEKSLKNSSYYAVRGRVNGEYKDVCGGMEGECLMKNFDKFLMGKVTKGRPDRCKKPVDRIEEKTLWRFLTFVIIMLFIGVVYYGMKFGELKRKIKLGGKKRDDEGERIGFKFFELRKVKANKID